MKRFLFSRTRVGASEDGAEDGALGWRWVAVVGEEVRDEAAVVPGAGVEGRDGSAEVPGAPMSWTPRRAVKISSSV